MEEIVKEWLTEQIKKLSAKKIRDELDSLDSIIDHYQEEAELYIDELKRRGLNP